MTGDVERTHRHKPRSKRCRSRSASATKGPHGVLTHRASRKDDTYPVRKEYIPSSLLRWCAATTIRLHTQRWRTVSTT